MTFSKHEIAQMSKTDFNDANNFIDNTCFEECYIYPICPTCSAANYLNTKSFGTRDKRRCRIQKLIAIFIAELQARRIIKNPEHLDKETLFYTIEAIKKIRDRYLHDFSQMTI